MERGHRALALRAVEDSKARGAPETVQQRRKREHPHCSGLCERGHAGRDRTRFVRRFGLLRTAAPVLAKFSRPAKCPRKIDVDAGFRRSLRRPPAEAVTGASHSRFEPPIVWQVALGQLGISRRGTRLSRRAWGRRYRGSPEGDSSDRGLPLPEEFVHHFSGQSPHSSNAHHHPKTPLQPRPPHSCFIPCSIALEIGVAFGGRFRQTGVAADHRNQGLVGWTRPINQLQHRDYRRPFHFEGEFRFWGSGRKAEMPPIIISVWWVQGEGKNNADRFLRP